MVVMMEQLVDVTVVMASLGLSWKRHVVVYERRGRVKVGESKRTTSCTCRWYGSFAKAGHWIASPRRLIQDSNTSDCCGRKERSFGKVSR